MHVGFLTSEYPHVKTGSAGGIGSSIYNLGNALVRQQQKVTVFVYGQKSDEEFTDQGITIVRIKNVRIKGLSWYFTRKKIQKIINLHIRARQLQLIEAPDWTGITAFMNLRCPVVIKLHGSDTYFCHLENRPVKRWNYLLERKALKTAIAHISVSSFTARLTNEVFGLDLNYEVIHNGIDLRNKFTRHEEAPDSNRILYVGTLIRKKGLLELPFIFNEVHKHYQETELILVGGDSGDIKTGRPSTWEMMKSLFAPDALSKVKYEGKKPHDQIHDYYLNSTVCVFPSFAEAFPVSWLEAMAMEKPIVASEIGWAGEIIEDGVSGKLCNPRDHRAFANHIMDILLDKELRLKLGINARERLRQHFTSEIIASKTVTFYKSLINE